MTIARTRPLDHRLIAAAAALLGAALTSGTRAGVININPPDAFVQGDPYAGTIVAHQRFRVSRTNWDLFVDRDANPSTITDNVGQAHLGNLSQMNGNWYQLTIIHTAGAGLDYLVTNRGPGGQGDLGSELIAWSGPVPAPFNSLKLESQAILPAGAAEVVLDVESFLFASPAPGLAVIGQFGDLSVSASADQPAQTLRNTLLADFDLSTIDWTLTGMVRPGVSPGVFSGNIDERLRL